MCWDRRVCHAIIVCYSLYKDEGLSLLCWKINVTTEPWFNGMRFKWAALLLTIQIIDFTINKYLDWINYESKQWFPSLGSGPVAGHWSLNTDTRAIPLCKSQWLFISKCWDFAFYHRSLSHSQGKCSWSKVGKIISQSAPS